MLGLSGIKLWGGIAGILALLGAFLWFRGVLHERSELKDWQHTVLVSTQSASHNPKLVERDVPKQITVMGDALTAFKNQIAVQNKAVDDLDQKRKDAIAERDRQAALRKEVIAQSKSLAQKLKNGALTPVEKEKLEAELRAVQDQAWEAGL